MAIIVKDTFTRANNTNTLGFTETGQEWKYINCAWGIANNRAYADRGNEPFPAYVEAGKSDVKITVDMPIVSDTFAFMFRLVHNSDSDFSFYLLHTNPVGIQYFNSTTWYETVANTGIYGQNGDTYSIELAGNQATVSRNGQQVLITTLNKNINATKHGLTNWQDSYRADYRHGLWDNFIIEDFNTGGTGTDGSTAFDVRQQLYQTSSLNSDTKQLLYASSSLSADTKQLLYADLSLSADTKFSLYQDYTLIADTKLVLFTDSSVLFDTLQQIYENGVDGSFTADILVKLYQDSNVQTDTKQAIYSDSAGAYDTNQLVFRDASTLFDTLQELIDNSVSSVPFDIQVVLYADQQTAFDTKQAWYTEGTFDVDTMQTLKEAAKQIIGAITLQGGSPSVIALKGNRQPATHLTGHHPSVIHLKGGRP